MHKLFHTKTSAVAENALIHADGFAYSGPLRRWKTSERRTVPAHIAAPDYAHAGLPVSEMMQARSTVIPVYSLEEIEAMREVNRIGRIVLDTAHRAVKVGVTTDEIDRIVHECILEHDAYPSPLNYHKFPKSLCTSVNEVICHGIPDFRPLEAGDIVNCDISVFKDGFHSDLNETYCVGEVADSSRRLIRAAYDSLQKAIAICKPGTLYREVGNVVSDHVEELGFSVVRTYQGHGIG